MIVAPLAVALRSPVTACSGERSRQVGSRGRREVQLCGAREASASAREGSRRRPPSRRRAALADDEVRDEASCMNALLIGYARVSTCEQDLTAQRVALERLGVDPAYIFTDHGLTGTNRARPGLRQALAACRDGDTLVAAKLDRLARSRQVAKAKGRLRGKQPKLSIPQQRHLIEVHNAALHHGGTRRTVHVARSTVYRTIQRPDTVGEQDLSKSGPLVTAATSPRRPASALSRNSLVGGSTRIPLHRGPGDARSQSIA